MEVDAFGAMQDSMAAKLEGELGNCTGVDHRTDGIRNRV